MIILQLLIYCLLFTAMVKIAVIGGAVNGLYFYPKEVQDRAIELGLIDRNTMNRKRKFFMIPFFIVMLAALVLILKSTHWQLARENCHQCPRKLSTGRQELYFS